MRSLRRGTLTIALAWTCAASGMAADSLAPSGIGPTPSQIHAAVEAVRADPLLGTPHTERRLHWKSDKPAADAPPPSPDWWWLNLIRWIAESARALVWVLGAVVVAVIAVLLRRWVLLRGDASGERASALPSHVRELDIRPESLPADIAAAARVLWQRGEQRAALSMLYRGALSRLVHEHAVPIRGASTEGECVALATRSLPDNGAGFFARLVRAWLLSVYGAQAVEDEVVMALCSDFDACLPLMRAEGGAAA